MCVGANARDKCRVQSIDDYQCSGSLEADFPQLCSLMKIREVPVVTSRIQTSTSPSADRRALEASQSQVWCESAMTTWCPKPRLQVELDFEDRQSVKEVKISGWKVDSLMVQVLSKILPSLSHLQSLHMWQVGLNDRTFASLKNTLFLCSNLRTVILEGNPLPEENFHLLMGEDSMLTHLSLRNNRIGEEGARLIGSALSTTRSANRNLVSLNLAFNSIGDAGAIHIAHGLRLNRTLLCLSLANNHIGDAGAAPLAEILAPFALTHEEVVERRRLLMSRSACPSQATAADSKCECPLSVPSSSSLEPNVGKGAKGSSKKKDAPKKDEKPVGGHTGGGPGKREEPKPAKKASDTKVPRGRAGRSGRKDKQPLVQESEDKNSAVQKSPEPTETVSPLLDPGVQHTGGRVIVPGNTALTALNLAGNKLTERSLPLFLSSVGSQGKGGLLHLRLQRNCFPPDCDTFLKIQEMMSLRDPLNRSPSGQVDDVQGQAA
ncbi:leucine-rich repeat-containing protein 71 [Chanos chanos]|uniref:Leucine-rich repeat-containing protein 71 n=1 Tax=Chanos chanos TaxID=29144 RepID=A0A6J2WM87_CHACN|nr:leucine-rich repeat-containing protein 71 [Chanos chanos]